MIITKRYVRVGFTAAQKTELRESWRRGEQMKSIGRELGKRSRLALSLTEREDISRGLVAGRSVRKIANLLGRAASTVSREIARNGSASRNRAVAAEIRKARGNAGVMRTRTDCSANTYPKA